MTTHARVKASNMIPFLSIIPSDVTKDRIFPFRSDDEVAVRIDKDRLIIEKPEQKHQDSKISSLLYQFLKLSRVLFFLSLY